LSRGKKQTGTNRAVQGGRKPTPAARGDPNPFRNGWTHKGKRRKTRGNVRGTNPSEKKTDANFLPG